MGNNPVSIIDPDGGIIKWASWRDVKQNDRMKGQFSSRSEFRKAKRVLKQRYKETIKNSDLAKGVYKNIDDNKKIYTIYAANDYGGGGTDHAMGEIIIGVNEKNFLNHATNQVVNTMAIIAHEGAHAWLHLMGIEPEDITVALPEIMSATKNEVDHYNSLKVAREGKASFMENMMIGEFISNGIKGIEPREFYQMSLLRFMDSGFLKYQLYPTQINVQQERVLSPRFF